MHFTVYDSFNRITPLQINAITNFLHEHLEKYGDTKEAIKKALKYAAKESAGLGGYIFTLEENNQLIAACIVNKTGMEDYIPENILVYIATHKDHRGKGIGKQLLNKIIPYCKGDIALHVEKDNPAKFLYKKLGFTTPYLEMRLIKK